MVTNTMDGNADVQKEFNMDKHVDKLNELFKKGQRRHEVDERLRTTLSELPQNVLDYIEVFSNAGDRSTNRQTLVLVVTQACEAGKHLDRVREWLPGYTVVEAKIWDCECCMEKTRQLQACNKCIEHMEAKNSYMSKNYVGVAVEECLARAADFTMKKCQSNCIKCRKLDIELTSKRIAVRNILNEYNALRKMAALRGLSKESSEYTPTQDCQKAMKILEHIDNYWRTGMQRIFIL